MPRTLDDYDYALPPERVAQHPPAERDGGRLLHFANGWRHYPFPQMVDFLQAGDCIVLNDSRVLPSRIYGRKASGGQIEILLERTLNAHECLVQMRAAKPLAAEAVVGSDAGRFLVNGRAGEFYHLTAIADDNQPAEVLPRFLRHGNVPLPPYITRAPVAADTARYQTIFAQVDGSVAAPTAGLHFTPAVLARLQQKGVAVARITLHVGAGTFQPIRTDLNAHRMHTECFCVPPKTAAAVMTARQNGKRVVAVGTTVLRTLETVAAANGGQVVAAAGETDLFIREGFAFATADVLLTNFHQPRTTLMVLVCAFGGYDRVMSGYRYAIANQLRFFSYGDCMLLTRHNA